MTNIVDVINDYIDGVKTGINEDISINTIKDIIKKKHTVYNSMLVN